MPWQLADHWFCTWAFEITDVFESDDGLNDTLFLLFTTQKLDQILPLKCAASWVQWASDVNLYGHKVWEYDSVSLYCPMMACPFIVYYLWWKLIWVFQTT